MYGNYKTKVFKDYQISSQTAELPLTLVEVKAQLRIDVADVSDDTYLTFLIKSVSNFFERYTQRTLIIKTFIAYLDCLSYTCGIIVKKSKLQIITKIEYLLDAVLTTWNASNYYFTDTNQYSSIYLTQDGSFPTDQDVRMQATKITFTAGYGLTNTSIPEDIKIAMLNHISYLYANRGDCEGDSSNSCKLPCTSKNIYDNYRIQPIAWEE